MKRILLVFFWILTASLVCSAQTTFYFPHVANGLIPGNSIWKTTSVETPLPTAISSRRINLSMLRINAAMNSVMNSVGRIWRSR